MGIDIKKTARLSAIELSKEQEQLFAAQLPNILNHFKKISVINTEGVEPLITPIEIKHILRKDEAETWENPETAVSNAAEKSGNLFKVPPVV